MMRLQSKPGVVLLPTYNSGERLVRTLREALQFHQPVIVIADACTDDSLAALDDVPGREKSWFLLERGVNGGKGAAVLTGLDWAHDRGFGQAIIMDADGQHAADRIPVFFEIAAGRENVMVLGVPIFGPDAPLERVRGRRVGNWWANLATWWGGIDDSLFGFRLLPVEPSRRILHSIRTARRFDFDTELAVRLFWEGICPVNCRVPVKYPPRAEGGISHFHYLRDNLLLVATHARLFFGMLWRIPLLWKLRRLKAGRSPEDA
jgi:glycosyltransferase involved in cell wall biosynthesis